MQDKNGALSAPLSNEDNGALCADADLRAAAGLFAGLTALPDVLRLLREQRLELSALKSEVKALRGKSTVPATDGWLDAKMAAKYLSVSPGTFDKFRYATTPAVKGYRLGGKMLYKKVDLDQFVMLFDVRSRGVA